MVYEPDSFISFSARIFSIRSMRSTKLDAFRCLHYRLELTIDMLKL